FWQLMTIFHSLISRYVKFESLAIIAFCDCYPVTEFIKTPKSFVSFFYSLYNECDNKIKGGRVMARSSGVLMHVSSLPNKFGIGTFGQSAYDFVDFLVRTKQTYWQILPLGTTSYGDSPYQSFSAIAGNLHFIDFDLLSKEDLLEQADYENVEFGDDPENVDFGTIFINRRPILEKAVANFLKRGKLEGYTQFVAENAHWLEDYAEFMAIKEDFGLVSWTEWDEDIRLRDKKALNEYRKKLVKEIEFHKVTQYFFFTQWLKLKAYANENEI